MGIANIINTSGGGGGGGSEIITNLVNSVDGAGLRLANQGYISCAHVSANKFGTNDFSVEWVISQEARAANADLFFSNLNGSNQPIDSAVIRWDVVQNDNIQLVFTNSTATETAYNFGYDPAPDLNEPTHYLVSADRSGNAVLYRNGAEIASVSIAASGSANLGNSGHPSVVGSPVTNMGAIGNVYRFRTYSKALSSDEAKNVFDRADVPTALVSNLLLDLDCAYANPTQSTVIQDRGPNNQDGTLNGTITQTNVIKQLNSTSARIGTSSLTPADGELMVDSVDVRNGNVRVIGGNQVQLLNAANDTNADIINSGGTGVAQLGLRVAGSEKVTISSGGNITTASDGIALKLDGSSNTTRGVFIRNTGGSAHGYLHTDGNLKIIAEDSGKSINFYTADDGSGTARMTIDGTGLATFSNAVTFSNGITVKDAADGMAQIQTVGEVTIADDASITLSTSSNQGALISVYHNTLGAAILFYVTYTAVAQILSDPNSLGSASDTDGKMCMIKSASSHSMTFKNRLGSSVTFKIAQLGGSLV